MTTMPFAAYDEHEAEPGYLSPPIHGDGSGHALPPIVDEPIVFETADDVNEWVNRTFTVDAAGVFRLRETQ